MKLTLHQKAELMSRIFNDPLIVSKEDSKELYVPVGKIIVNDTAVCMNKLDVDKPFEPVE